MGSMSTRVTESADTQNAADFNRELAFEELGQSDAKYVVYDNDILRVESNGSRIQTSEQSYTPCEIKELQDTHDEEVKEEEEQEREKRENIQEVCETEEKQAGFSLPHLAVEHTDTETARSLSTSSVDANVVDESKNKHSQLYATANGLIIKNANADPRNSFGQTHSAVDQRILNIHGIIVVPKSHWEQQFYLAAMNGQANTLDELLHRGIYDFVILSSYYYETPLHVAVRKRHTKVVEVILKHRCKI